MKLNKLILSMIGFSMVALLVGCSSSATDASGEDNNNLTAAEDGQYRLIMAGSSGHGTMMVDSEDMTRSMLKMHFDTNQDGVDDINIDTNGVDLKEGFTHTDGTTVKLADGNKLEVKVTNHGTIITAVEKYEGDGSNLETYRGVLGERESIFTNNNITDKAASDGIQNRLELFKVVFNVILNTSTKKFRYVLKSIDVKNPPPGDNAHRSQSSVAEGSYTVAGDIYTFTLTGGEPQVLKKVGDNFVKSEFSGIQCDNEFFPAPSNTTPLKKGSATGIDGQYKTINCPGNTAHVGGKKIVAGEYFFTTPGAGSPNTVDFLTVRGEGSPTTSERVMESYTELTKQ